MRSGERSADHAGGDVTAGNGAGSTALLVMDFQRGVVERYPQSVVARAVDAVAAARAYGVQVIYVTISFRPGQPEISSANRMFASIRASEALLDGQVVLHPGFSPAGGEVSVKKRRVSAFVGSDLELVLRAGGYRFLALCGVATSGVVLSTFCAAADMDFGLTVLHDACGDRDQAMHDMLVNGVFPKQGDVVDVATWRSRLSA